MQFPIPISMSRLLIWTVVVIPNVLLCQAIAQRTQATAEKQRQLKLEVIPSKKVYKVGEPIAVSYRLTSLVDGTLCFPPPAIEVSGTFSGYVTRELRSLDGNGSIDFFIEGYWPVHPSEETLRTDIATRWIKLGMSEPYHTRKSDKILRLQGAGGWALQATYHPPALTSSDNEIVNSMGCSSPYSSVQSEWVVVTVDASSD